MTDLHALTPAHRSKIVLEARKWLGTSFVHRANICGVGVDCIGLLRGIWQSCLGTEPYRIPAYTYDWRTDIGPDPLTETMRTHFAETPIGNAQSGDVLLFRMRMGAPARHCGILTDQNTLIHAYFGHGVVETHLVPWWTRRICGAFSFPQFKAEA